MLSVKFGGRQNSTTDEIPVEALEPALSAGLLILDLPPDTSSVMIEKVCRAYELEAMIDAQGKGSLLLVPRNIHAGGHAKAALILFVAALEIYARSPNARCWVHGINRLAKNFERSGATAHREHFQGEYQAWRNSGSKFSVDGAVSFALHAAGLRIVPSTETHHLDRDSIIRIRSQILEIARVERRKVG